MREKKNINLKRCWASSLKVRQRFFGIWEEWVKWKVQEMRRKRMKRKNSLFVEKSWRRTKIALLWQRSEKERIAQNESKRSCSTEGKKNKKKCCNDSLFCSFNSESCSFIPVRIGLSSKMYEWNDFATPFIQCVFDYVCRFVVHSSCFCNKIPMVFLFHHILEMMPCHVCMYFELSHSLSLSFCFG